MSLKNFFSNNNNLLIFPILMSCILIFVMSPVTSHAKQMFSPEKPHTHILVVYSTEDGQVNSNVRRLEMLLGHFTTHIVIKSAKEVNKEDFSDITALFYYGGVEANLSQHFRHLSDTFKGKYVAMGANVEQLGTPFSFVNVKSQTSIKQLMISTKSERVTLPNTNQIYEFTMNQPAEVLEKGLNKTKSYPLFVQRQSHFYFGRVDLYGPFSVFLGKGLHHVFKDKIMEIHPAYIRLEDVDPMENPERLMKIAKFLKQKHIPYMVAVIPVYKNPKTHESVHYSDKPKVVKALRYMQKNGGSIVMHGYTHQFRKGVTGEGFEFWDVNNNTPIVGPPDQKHKTKDDFTNKSSYKAYKAKQRQFEKDYITKKLTKGIQELTSNQLYPLAFEAPHYTMSLEGYKIVSNYFSTYVGQIQLSNKNWKISGTSPYITRPSFLNNMLLLPETIGYVPENDKNAIPKMMKKANQNMIVKDGVVAGFYHPYLGLDRLKKLVNNMEEIPNLHWINLKKVDNSVKAPEVSITSGSQGVIVQSNLKSVNHIVKFTVSNIREILLWILSSTAMIGVVLVIVCTLFQKKRRVN
ncbi:polysaccharide deacetylase family protein [Tuberibacillus sp. Marseille-P3662]|uniref:polysaccharide deacetylase family protein n=1 Tax=Tuberibacillus sp. Marseille-P3662 TaxID=1965358 RepID=UPI001593B877|nr:polysaccharide deacetylase family protein [Tuberibacillus sp. Marseille-P3662]